MLFGTGLDEQNEAPINRQPTTVIAWDKLPVATQVFGVPMSGICPCKLIQNASIRLLIKTSDPMSS